MAKMTCLWSPRTCKPRMTWQSTMFHGAEKGPTCEWMQDTMTAGKRAQLFRRLACSSVQFRGGVLQSKRCGPEPTGVVGSPLCLLRSQDTSSFVSEMVTTALV